MNEDELKELILQKQHLQKYFLGVFASDELPYLKLKKRKCCFIANTQPRGLPGEHWVAFWLENNQQPRKEYFDPFGLPPNVTSFKEFLYPKFTYSKRFLQNAFTNICGLYAIHFLDLRAKSISYAEIIEKFYDDPFKNDKIILNFFESEYIF